MKKYFSFIFLILFTISCASTASVEDAQKATAHYQLGVSYLNENDIQPAFVEFQKALEINPNDKNIHNAIGIIYLQKLEDYQKAINHFKEALKIDEFFPEALNNLGNTYAKIGEFDKSVDAYKKAISNPLYKNTASALYNLGMVYYRIAKYDDAIDAFKEALKRFSNFHLPYYGIALSYNARGQYGDASIAVNRAIKLDPLYKGNKEKAIEDLREQKLKAKGEEEKDIIDYLEILKY